MSKAQCRVITKMWNKKRDNNLNIFITAANCNDLPTCNDLRRLIFITLLKFISMVFVKYPKVGFKRPAETACFCSRFILYSLSHAGQNYWMLIGWDRGHSVSLIKRALLVIKRAWLLDADWLSTPSLNWFPASNGFWKGISETHRFCVWS